MHQDNVARRDRSGNGGRHRGRDERSGCAGNQCGRKTAPIHHHVTNSMDWKGLVVTWDEHVRSPTSRLVVCCEKMLEPRGAPVCQVARAFTIAVATASS